MAKDQKTSKAAAAPKVEATKVKAGRVSKEQPKKASKETAKKTAEKVDKKKKSKKEPTPEPSSSEEDDTSASSDSSDSESEAEVQQKKPAKTNGVAKKPAAKDDSDSDSDSDSSDGDSSDGDGAPTPKKAEAPKVNGAAKAAADSDSDSSGSDSSSDEEEKPKAQAKAGAEESADSSDSDSGSGSDSDSSEDEEEEKPKAEEKPSKKRKAEDTMEAAPKKTKVMVQGEEKEPCNNLFCGNLSWNIDEDWLGREFESFGEIKGCRVITDRDSGRSKGFGYVEFADVNAAITAIESKQGAMIDGRDMRIDFSHPRPARADGEKPADRARKFGDTPSEISATLWVGNVSFNADEATLTDAFAEYGELKGVRIPTDRETGAPKGFAYVEFYTTDESKAAFEGLNGADVAGRALRIDYSTPKPNDGGGRGGRGGGRGGFGDRGGRGGRGGGRGGFGDRGGRGGARGGARGGRGGAPTTNRGGFGDFSGKKVSFD